jgi:hypothetical protein
VLIEGPRVFAEDERVAVVYAPAGAVGPPWELLAAAIVVAAVVIAGSVVGYRRMGGDATTADGANEAANAASAAGAASGADPNGDDEATGADADPDPGGAAPADPEGASGAGAGAAAEADRSLLSDEERVERLLAENGGRMRQADIVDETDWSDAKVSQLLSAMADEGRVDKLRLGRENLISLPDGADDGGDGDGGNGDGGDVADVNGGGGTDADGADAER